MRNIRAFLVLAISSLLAVSCLSDESFSSSITITPVINETGFKSKADIDSLSFLDGQGNVALTLYNTPCLPDDSSEMTKGTLVNDLATMVSVHGGTIKTSAYEGATPLFQNAIATRQEDGKWTINTEARWKSEHTLEFFGCAPSDMNVTFVPNTTPGSANFSYSVPSSASDQKDILLGYYKGEGNLGTCPMKFTHPLTSVRFSFSGTGAFPGVVTVNSVSIQGIATSGDCTVLFNNLDGSSPSYLWSVASTGNYTQTISSAPASANAETFILIPQTFGSSSEAKIIVNITTSTETKDIVASLAGTEWLSGKTYNYALEYSEYEYIIEEIPDIVISYTGSNEPVNIKSYRRNVKTGEEEAVPWTIQFWNGSQWVDSNPSAGDWSLLSSVSLSSGIGKTSSEDPEISTLNLTAQNGSEVSSPDQIENYYRNVLQNVPEKSDYDLSYDNPATGVRSSQPNSANCYVVNAPGTYKFPMVYGNALKNGEQNSYAINDGDVSIYRGNPDETFVDHRDKPLKHMNIVDQLQTTSGYDAVIVWQDAENLVTNPSVDITNNCVRFTVSSNNIRQGNSVIALRLNGTIVWSWHIWVTDIDLSETIALTDRANSTIDHLFMPYNLGWIIGGFSKAKQYQEREISMRVTNGKAKKQFKVHQNKYVENSGEYKSTWGFCPFYQWGRKDPIIPGDGIKNANNNHYVHCPSGYTPQPQHIGRATIGEAIQNPHISYSKGSGSNTNQDDWCKGHYYTGSNPSFGVGFANLWSATDVWPNGRADIGNSEGYDYPYGTGNVKTSNMVAYQHYVATTIKTIYDPSPVGFCIPNVYAFDDMIGKSNVNAALNGATFETHQGKSFFIPMVGYRGCYEWDQDGTHKMGVILGFADDYHVGSFYASNAISRQLAPYASISTTESFATSVFFKTVASCVRPVVEAEYIQYSDGTQVETWVRDDRNRHFQ